MFLLSKIFFIFLSPLVWQLILLLLYFRTSHLKLKRVFLSSILIILVVFTNPYVYRLCVNKWQPERNILSTNAHFGTVILLGGFIGYDRKGNGYFESGADRYIQTLKLFHAKKFDRLLISGGNGKITNNPSEADFLEKEFIKDGIPKNIIIQENKSTNTFQNAFFSKKIVDSLNLKGPYLLITSAMHMNRSSYLFEKAGFKIQIYPCSFLIHDEKINFENSILPSLSLYEDWKYFIKEIIGLLIYQIAPIPK